MTKVEAIEKVMEDNGGTATLAQIYDNITKYYPTAKDSKAWEAGLRGVLYREIRSNRNFKKLGLSIYALKDYKEEQKPNENDNIRMHSYIEGICLELGLLNKFDTYSADPSAPYKDNTKLNDFMTMKSIPHFSYDEIVQEVKRIDVVWFNRKGLQFPNRVFEVVDSIGTLDGAFNRSLQLNKFRTEFYIVAPEKHHAKFDHTIHLERYSPFMDSFKFVSYDDMIGLYNNEVKANEYKTKIFGNQ